MKPLYGFPVKYSATVVTAEQGSLRILNDDQDSEFVPGVRAAGRIVGVLA